MEPANLEPTPHISPTEGTDPPVLVAVVTTQEDLWRATKEGWYRIPVRSAPGRLAAEYLAFYQTRAFPPGERFLIRWIAPVKGYLLATRRQLIPAEPEHPRATDQYFRVSLGNVAELSRPIPSARLRRVTFIPTTLGRLQEAREINDLWIRDSAQERLWKAFQQAGVEAECQYPLRDDLPQCLADFAVFCQHGRIAVAIEDASGQPTQVSGGRTSLSDYLASAESWVLVRVSAAASDRDPALLVKQVSILVNNLGGIAAPGTDMSPVGSTTGLM
jgi:hypothetical protein